jgi:CO dehydrogenase/acetyl-CoA synthase beta subunit
MLGCSPDEKQASKYDPEGVFHVAKKDLLSDSFGLLKTLNNFNKNSLTPEKLKIID